VIELEDVDLAKVLDMLAKRLARLARDIPLELDDPRFALKLADALEETAPLLREHAAARLPAVVDSTDYSEEWELRMTGHPVEHSDEDAEARRLQAEAERQAREARTQQEPDGGE